MEEKHKDEYYTVNELVVLLKVGRKTLFTYIQTKELKAFKVGNSLRVRREDLETFILKQQIR
jgi:excisionase family DNA binding protein